MGEDPAGVGKQLAECLGGHRERNVGLAAEAQASHPAELGSTGRCTRREARRFRLKPWDSTTPSAQSPGTAIASPHRMRLAAHYVFAWALAITGCESERSDSSLSDAGSPDAEPQADAGSAETYDPAAIYDLEAIMDLRGYDVQVADDHVIDVGDGRFVRSFRFGFAHGGFPEADTMYGVGGHLHVESDALGQPVGDTSAVALALYGGVSRPGFSLDCALRTGVTCVVATTNVLGPSELSPRYRNEFDAESADINNSNVLLFNMLSEMRRGSDASGAALVGPPIGRSYVVNISEASMRLVSATQRVLLDLDLAAEAPERFAITGHSKWGAAAAQLAAVDPRVVGALAAGWTIDWLRWVELAREQWLEALGIDAWEFFCTDEEPCEWTTTERFASFISSTTASPQMCGQHPCPGTGEDYLRQIDIRRLIDSGALAGHKLALVRNGHEAHHVEIESQVFEEGVDIGQFLFLPLSGHVQNTEEHASIWRHWVRHLLSDTEVLTASITELGHDLTETGLDVHARVLDASAIKGARLWTRISYDSSYGALDSIPSYIERCTNTETCSSWSATSMTIADDELAVSLGALDLIDAEGLAYLVELEFDDGSGDVAIISSPTRFVPLE